MGAPASLPAVDKGALPGPRGVVRAGTAVQIRVRTRMVLCSFGRVSLTWTRFLPASKLGSIISKGVRETACSLRCPGTPRLLQGTPGFSLGVAEHWTSQQGPCAAVVLLMGLEAELTPEAKTKVTHPPCGCSGLLWAESWVLPGGHPLPLALPSSLAFQGYSDIQTQGRQDLLR